MVDVSIIIPIATYHKQLAERAIASAKAQTAPCITHVIEDNDSRGAGWARNEGLRQAQTHFVVFLDADDWLEPNFIARCLQTIRPNHYVYTDWYQEDRIVNAPERAWRLDGKWHVITTLLETGAVRAVGGFDESLPVAEDAHLYWALTRNNICGIHLSEPLFHYGAEGQRGKAYMQLDNFGNPLLQNGEPVMLPQMRQIMQRLAERYNGMSCCGDNMTAPLPDGKPEPDDILVYAIWGGNRNERGTVTGRKYPRSGNGKQMWVARIDAEARPDLWRPIEQQVGYASPYIPPPLTAPPPKVYTDMAELAQVAFGLPEVKKISAEELAKTIPAEVRPNVNRVLELTGKQTLAPPPDTSDIKAQYQAEMETMKAEYERRLKEVQEKIIEPDKPIEKPKRGRKPKASTR